MAKYSVSDNDVIVIITGKTQQVLNVLVQNVQHVSSSFRRRFQGRVVSHPPFHLHHLDDEVRHVS